MEDVEVEAPIQFRIKCKKTNVGKPEPLKKHLYNIMESAKEVRKQHEAFHRIVHDPPKPIKFKFTTLDQLIYARTKGCMSLATFLAVDKAYQAKDREEKLLTNQEKVYELKLAKKKSKQRALMHQKRRAKEFSNLQDYDQAVTRAALKERDDYYNLVKDKYRSANYEIILRLNLLFKFIQRRFAHTYVLFHSACKLKKIKSIAF